MSRVYGKRAEGFYSYVSGFGGSGFARLYKVVEGC